MLALLWSIAFAAAPAGINLDDTSIWEAASEVMLDGPPGCWEVVGTARWDYRFAQFGSARGTAIFISRLEDGVWTDFELIPQGEMVRRGKSTVNREYSQQRHFAPLMGRTEITRRAAVAKGPVNLLRVGLEEISGDVEVSWAEWVDGADSDDGPGVMLHRAVPIGNGKKAPEAKVTVFFPNGGTVPRSFDVQLPESFKIGSFPKSVKVRDGRIQMRAQHLAGVAFPAVEAWSANFSVLGYRGYGAQTLTYSSAVPCGFVGPTIEQAASR